MKTRKILSLALALALCLGLLVAPAGAAEVTITEMILGKYDFVWDISDGFVEVALDDKHGFVDQTGKEVVPCKYDEVWDSARALRRWS